MQSLKSIALIAILLISFETLSSTKQSIILKLRELRQDLNNSTASTQELEEVYLLLEEAQIILVQGQAGPVDFTTCYNYIYPIYDRTTSSSQASTKTTAACKDVYDMAILEFSYERFERSLSSRNAMDKAVSFNTRDIKGKIDIVEFAFDKYDRTFSSTNAVEKALKGAQTVSKNALGCLQLVFPKHDRTTSSANAMDKAFADCQ